MPSEDSLPDEAPLCQCGHPPASHDKLKRRLCIGNRNLCGCSGFTMEPKGSTTPPLDERCAKCAALGRDHAAWGQGHLFVPAEPDHEEHIAASCREAGGCPRHPVPADAETAGEPEAPEPWPCGDCGAMVPAGQDWCRNCGDVKPEAPEAVVCTHDHWDEAFMRCQDCGFEPESPGSPAPPRPPFLVAYATGSGALIELALPGSAGVAVVNGALVVTHPSSVLGIQHVKPLEN